MQCIPLLNLVAESTAIALLYARYSPFFGLSCLVISTKELVFPEPYYSCNRINKN